MKSPSIRQKKVIEKMIGNGGNMAKSMKEAGYSEAYADNPQKIKSTKTWEALLEEYLPDDLLTKVALEGLFAKRIQTSPTEGDREVEDYAVRQRYLETTLKMKGKIIAKTDLTTLGQKINPSFTVATQEAKESLEQLYAGSNSTDDKGISR
jgi:hypothetical protein